MTVVALQGVQISLQENLPLRLPEGRRVGGAGDLACLPPPISGRGKTLIRPDGTRKKEAAPHAIYCPIPPIPAAAWVVAPASGMNKRISTLRFCLRPSRVLSSATGIA